MFRSFYQRYSFCWSCWESSVKVSPIEVFLLICRNISPGKQSKSLRYCEINSSYSQYYAGAINSPVPRKANLFVVFIYLKLAAFLNRTPGHVRILVTCNSSLGVAGMQCSAKVRQQLWAKANVSALLSDLCGIKELYLTSIHLASSKKPSEWRTPPPPHLLSVSS